MGATPNCAGHLVRDIVKRHLEGKLQSHPPPSQDPLVASEIPGTLTLGGSIGEGTGDRTGSLSDSELNWTRVIHSEPEGVA